MYSEWGIPSPSDAAAGYGALFSVTTTSTSFTIPQFNFGTFMSGNAINNPSMVQTGFFFLSVDGASVGLNFTSQTYANSFLKIPPGAYLTKPLFFPPGKNFWLITNAGVATFNLIRAVRVG